MNSISAKLRELRTSQGLTMKEASAKVGKSFTYTNYIENKGVLRIDAIRKYALALGYRTSIEFIPLSEE